MTPTIPDGNEISVDLTEKSSTVRKGDIVWYLHEGKNYVHRVGIVREDGYDMVADGEVEPHVISKEAVLGLVQTPWWNRGKYGWMIHHVARAWRLIGRIPSLFDPTVRIPDENTCNQLVMEQYSDAEEVGLYRGDVPAGLTEIETRLVEKFLAPPGRILNVGCGPGREALVLARMGFEVVGIDRSPAMVQSARQVFDSAGIPISLECVEAGNYQAPSGSFDGIYFSVGSPSYGLVAGRRRRIALLRHFRSLLKPNGLLMFSVIYDKSVSKRGFANLARIIRSGLGGMGGKGFHGERGDTCFVFGAKGRGRGFHHVFESPRDVLEEIEAGGFCGIEEIEETGAWVCRPDRSSNSTTAGQVALTLLYEREAIRIIRRASEEGLQVVLLKGLALLASGWADPLTRTVYDVDILARPHDLETLGRILRELGYREMDFGDARVKSYQNNRSLLVEVHTHVIPQTQCLRAYRVDMDEVWSAVRRVEWDGTSVWVLSREWMLLHAILHLGLRHGLRGEKWFADIFHLASGRRSDFGGGGPKDPPLEMKLFNGSVKRMGAARLTRVATWAAYQYREDAPPSPWGRPSMFLRRMAFVNLRVSLAQELVETAWPWILADGWKQRWAMCVPERRRREEGRSPQKRIAEAEEFGAVYAGSRFMRLGRFLIQGVLGLLVLGVCLVIPKGAVTEARTKRPF